MTTLNDGGPAFPCQPCDIQGQPFIEAHSGISARDYFFAAALTGLCANPHSWDSDQSVVQLASLVADEAMTQRAKGAV